MALYSALPNRIVLVAGFLACVLAEDCATNEVVSQWTRIGHCAGRTIEDRLDYTPASIMEMATLATRVRICTQGSPSDCVTSKSQTVIRVCIRACDVRLPPNLLFLGIVDTMGNVFFPTASVVSH